MDERDTRDPLRDLGERLERAGHRKDGPAGDATPAGETGGDRSVGPALRIGLELVVAVGVGVGIGWAFDTWLGTRPWGMILFFFLGIGAGMLNVYRTVAGLGMAMGYRQQRQPAAETKNEWSDDED
jgi:ATP synthase protein I